jgi:hypothetical protein
MKYSKMSRNAILIDYRDGWAVGDKGFFADLKYSRTVDLPSRNFEKAYKAHRKKAGLYKMNEELEYKKRGDEIRELIAQSAKPEYEFDVPTLALAPYSFRYNNKLVDVYVDDDGQRTQPIAALTLCAPQPGLWGNAVLEYRNTRYEFDQDTDLEDVYQHFLFAVARYWKEYFESMMALDLEQYNVTFV